LRNVSYISYLNRSISAEVNVDNISENSVDLSWTFPSTIDALNVRVTDEKTLNIIETKDLAAAATGTSFGNLLPLTKYEAQITASEADTKTRIIKSFTTTGMLSIIILIKIYLFLWV